MKEEPLDLQRFLRAVSRGKRTVGSFAIAGLMAAVLFTVARPPLHDASTVVLLPPAPQGASGQSTRDVPTEVEVATSAVVLQLASRALPDHPSIGALKREVVVSGPTPNVLVFKGRAKSARRAIAVSNAAANAYQSYAKDTANDQAQRVIAPLNERIRTILNTNADLQSNINDALVRQSGLDQSSQAYVSLNAQIAQWQSQIQTGTQELQTDRNQIAAAEATGTGNSAISVISPAAVASNNIVDRTALNLVSGALVGLLLGTTIVIARDSRRRKPRTLDLAAPAGVPIVASLAAHRARKPSEWFALLEQYEPNPDEQWGLRKLLRTILAADDAAPARAIVVSLVADDRALAIAAQLASFVARAGLRTVLVVDSTAPSVRALRQVRNITATSGVVPRDNLSIVEELPAEPPENDPPFDLVVRMVVTDHADAFEVDNAEGATILLAVSPDAATPQQIESVSDAAADANAPLAGIVVANPDADEASERAVPDRGHTSRQKRNAGSAS